MRKLELKHRLEREQEHRDVFCRVRAVMRVHEVHTAQLLSKKKVKVGRPESILWQRCKFFAFRSCFLLCLCKSLHAYPVADLFQSSDDPLHSIVVSIKFDLSRTIKDDIIISASLELLFEPIHIIGQILHAIDDASVGSQLQVLHCVLERDQLQNRDVGWVRQRLVSRIEVHDRGLSRWGGATKYQKCQPSRQRCKSSLLLTPSEVKIVACCFVTSPYRSGTGTCHCSMWFYQSLEGLLRPAKFQRRKQGSE